MGLIDDTHGCISCGVTVMPSERSLLCEVCVDGREMKDTNREPYGIIVHLTNEGPVELPMIPLELSGVDIRSKFLRGSELQLTATIVGGSTDDLMFVLGGKPVRVGLVILEADEDWSWS